MSPGSLLEVLHEVRFQRPQALWLLALAVPWLLLGARASLTNLPVWQRALATLARAATLAALACALGGPVVESRSREVFTVFLVDVSESVSREALAASLERLTRLVGARTDRDARAVAFARRPVTFDPRTATPESLVARVGPRDGTHIASALAFSYGLFPPDRVRRVVLLSDGLQTDGDVTAEVARARRLGVRVSVVPPTHLPPAEVAVRELRLPEQVRVNAPFDVAATVFSTRRATAHLRLMQGESLNGLDGERAVTLQPGLNELRFRSVVRVPGDVTYRLTATAPEDRFRQNNSYLVSTHVQGPPAVLYLDGDPARAGFFRAGLAAGGFEVDARGPREVPQSLAELERFDFVVLSDIAADAVSRDAQQALSSYVRDRGGGFMMAGGARGFSLGQWAGTEVERMLPVHMTSNRRRDQPSVALALVIDRSGSMQGTPLMLAQSAALATAQALGDDDLLEVIAFDSEPSRVVRMQPATNRARIENELRRLRSGGGTAIFPALDAAAQDLMVTRAITRHVILLTDGEGQPDEVGQIQALVDAMFADGVTVSTVGLGTTVNRQLLDGVAQRGHGRSYFTADASNLPQIFVREANLVARNSAVEEPVLPRVVGDAAFLRELRGEMPHLYGFVDVRARAAPAQVLLETDRASPEPLLARWRFGLGWSLAWTSDLKNRWAVEWIRWPRWSAFWTQLVRDHMRPRQEDELGLRAEVYGGALRVSVDAIGGRDRFDNGLESELAITGPLPAQQVRRVPMRQVAPGRYEAVAPMDQYGAFTLRATQRRGGRVVAARRGQVSNPYPREFASTEADVGLLTALARATGARVDPSAREVWDAGPDAVRHERPLWPRPVAAAVGLLVLDLLLRRVRFVDRRLRTPKRR